MHLSHEKHFVPVHYNNRYIVVDSTITPDSKIAAALAPYKKRVAQVMGTVVGYSDGTFLKKRPEGALGNLVADAVRDAAARIKSKKIDISVITNSSIKYELLPGNITRQMVYDIMPYNNNLVILRLSGKQVREMANEIAYAGGEPISGFRMRIDGKHAEDILIGRHVLHPDSTYTVATNDYMANGGGDIPALWHPKSRVNESISIRKCIEDYINNRMTIRPELDGRIR